MNRRARRNPGMGTTPSSSGKSRFREKTYYNDEYREQHVFKTVIIIAAILITVSVIVIVGSYAVSGNDKKTEATKNVPSITHSDAEGDISEPTLAPDVQKSDSAESGQTIEPTDDPEPSETPMPVDNGTVLKYKSDSAEVKQMQDRLVELGYLHIDETTTYFGKQTEIAVKAFQRQHGFDMNGEANEEVLNALYSVDAKEYELKDGDEGDDVTILQEMLKKLGYIDQSSVTGHYGSATRHAIRDFQDRNDLEKTSIANKETIDLLYRITSKR